jgi:hypothetical protein
MRSSEGDSEVTYDGADLRAALEASCLRGALPPVDLPVGDMLARCMKMLCHVQVVQ